MTGGTNCSLVYRTIWLSDIHLGCRHSKAEYLLELLRRTKCKTLYLVGDVIDLWAMRRQWCWPSTHSEVIRALIDKAASGTEVIYIAGNHDELFRQFNCDTFGPIKIRRPMAHLTARGQRLLVTHGDEFERSINIGRMAKWIGSLSYELLLKLNRYNNWVRRLRGKPYWSLATYIKNRVANARTAIANFEEAAVAYARKHGYDGVICGHLHQPEIRHIGGLLYCNDGDWIENCTVLVERIDGGMELIHWADIRHSFKSLPFEQEQVLDAVVPIDV